MKIYRHRDTNQVLVAEDCFDLPVVVTRTEADAPYDLERSSYWLPSNEELQLLIAGAPLRLVILGPYHPPVRIEVGE